MPALKPFSDHFSGHAGSYAAHRPIYPASLFRDLAALCVSHECAWDCATGNGQAARSLVPYFDRVIATDASEQQIASADRSANIDFHVARAENSGLDSGSVDLITVAQALHWFDINAFMLEAERVLKPRGVLAFWCYQNCIVEAAVDRIVLDIYAQVDEFWPPEREIVETQYPSIEMPFDEEWPGDYCMQANWTADELLDYMRTWSAVQRCRQATGNDPVDLNADALRAHWGAAAQQVRWPMVLRVGRKRLA